MLRSVTQLYLNDFSKDTTMYDNYTPTKVKLVIADFHNDSSVREAAYRALNIVANGRTPDIDMGGRSSLDVTVKYFGASRLAEFEFHGMDNDFAAEFGSVLVDVEGIEGVVILDGESWNPCIRTFGFSDDGVRYNVTELVHQEVVSEITRAFTDVVVNRDL